MKTVDFSETIAASDLKGSRGRQPIRRYVSTCIEGQVNFLTLAQGRVHIKISNWISSETTVPI